jgi:hypothetical protein
VRSVNVDRGVSGQHDAVKPPVLVVVVRDGMVLGGAVVPDWEVARLPYSANSVLQLGDSRLCDQRNSSHVVSRGPCLFVPACDNVV